MGSWSQSEPITIAASDSLSAVSRTLIVDSPIRRRVMGANLTTDLPSSSLRTCRTMADRGTVGHAWSESEASSH